MTAESRLSLISDMRLPPSRNRRSFGGAQPLLGKHKGVDAEVAFAVGPHSVRLPPDAARERPQRVRAVLVAVLGVDGLARAEVDRLAGHPHLLSLQTGEVHLDAVALAIVEGMVFEAFEPKVRAK